MIEIKDKAFVPQSVYFPKSIDINLDSYDLVLNSELMQKSYTFSGLTDESKSKNYFKFSVDFSEVDDAEYNYTISNTCTGLIRIGEIEDQLPDRYNYNPFTDEDSDNEIVQYYPNGNFKYRFQPNKIVEILENGVVNVKPDSGYTALLNVEIHTDVPQTGHTDEEIEQAFNSGYTSGVTDGIEEQKSKLISTAITSNGTFIRENGYNSVNVNVPVENYYNSGYTSGYTDGFNTGYTSGCTDGYKEGYGDGFESGETYGIQEQKAKLVTTAFTQNGTFTKEDGYKTVTVNVPTGETINNQTKSLNITENGTSAVTFDNGYTGLQQVNVNVNIAQTGHTDQEMEQAYNSGVTEGTRAQKARLTTTAVTSNGTYARPDGYSSIEVNVPTGSTIVNQTKTVNVTVNGSSAITFDNGYTGLEKVNLNVNIAQTGHTDQEMEQAYSSGVTSGVTYQKSLLVSTAVTTNGTYARPDGYSSIEVNVPDRFQDGYTSGYTDGYEDGRATIEFYSLTVNVSSDVHEQLSKLIGNAAVTVSYGSSSTTQTYNGSALIFEIVPGINYTVSFSGVSDFNTPNSITGTTTWGGSRTVTGNYEYIGGDVPYDEQYLTIEIISGNTTNTLKFDSSSLIYSPAIQVSVNNGEWQNKYFKSGDGSDKEISGLTVGDKIRVRGANSTYYSGVTGCYFNAGSTISVNVYGNVMSLFYLNNFVMLSEFVTGSSYNLKGMFRGDKNIKYINANNLILPATTLTNNCYDSLFIKADTLISAPALPATTLAYECYYGMFNKCTSLQNAPALPATTLANYCYHGMFNGCTSLQNTPALPSTTLANYCYYGMFEGCTSLTTTPTLPATTLTEGCYKQMFSGCSGLTSAPVLSSTSLANNCYEGMFTSCISLTTAPALPATTLANYCYQSMFAGCTSLTTAPTLSAATLTDYCYSGMFRNCSNLNYIKCLATTIPTNSSTSYWVENVSTNGTFVKASSMESWISGVNGTPLGWTIENA